MAVGEVVTVIVVEVNMVAEFPVAITMFRKLYYRIDAKSCDEEDNFSLLTFNPISVQFTVSRKLPRRLFQIHDRDTCKPKDPSYVAISMKAAVKLVDHVSRHESQWHNATSVTINQGLMIR